MIEDFEYIKRPGKFTVSSGKEIHGELTLAGKDTSLYLHDNEHFDVDVLHHQCVKGILIDLTKVTLINCIPHSSGTKYSSTEKERAYYSEIFPHFIVFGNININPEDNTIIEVHFAVDDANALFYDFDAFGSLIDARPFIEQIVHANKIPREVEIGQYPEILYYTGKYEIFAADTNIGKISAVHNPTISRGAGGAEIKDTIFIIMKFRDAITFSESIAHLLTLLRYLTILAGRAQNLVKIRIRIKSEDEMPLILKVYWSMPPGHRDSDNERKPHPADVLTDGAGKPKEFSNILTNWIDRNQTWHDARCRFYSSFTKNGYSIDRLIGAANMFDILPPSAISSDVHLSEDQIKVRDACKKMFLEMPQSIERDIVLSALGRMGKSSLKHKIQNRGKIIIAALGERFKDLFTVTDEAVKCRNHYVHGSEPSFDYNKNFDMVDFFTDTLEFVFAVSDLIEAGWDACAWSKEPTGMTHPFGRYRIGYSHDLVRLQKLLTGQEDGWSRPEKQNS